VIRRPASSRKQPIDAAPRDGSWIIVLAGPKQEPVEAHWSSTFQGWTSREWVVQHLVTHWIPCAEVHGPRIADFGSGQGSGLGRPNAQAR
jgi:hypothetical protein